MHLFLTFSLIISFINFSLCDEPTGIKDYSEECQNGQEIFIYLTNGMGVSDSSVGLVATESEVNCTMKFYVKNGNSVMVVVEFPDNRPNETICFNKNNTVNMVSRGKSSDVCHKLNTIGKRIYRSMSLNLVNLRLAGMQMNTIRITATSMRDPGDDLCSDSEIVCLYKKKLMCMHSVVSCDGHTNCGILNKFDEDHGFCEKTTLTPKIIIWSVIIFSVLFWLSVSITFSIMTKRKETFVYKFDDTMFLFGSEKSYSNIDIQIQTILPLKKKTPDVKSRIKKKTLKAKRKTVS